MSADRDPGWHDGIDIRMGTLGADNNVDGVLLKPEVGPHGTGETVEPFLSLNGSEAERLMTSMWRLGVRPEDKPELTAGEREALQDKAKELDEARMEHIGDLRSERDHLRSAVAPPTLVDVDGPPPGPELPLPVLPHQWSLDLRRVMEALPIYGEGANYGTERDTLQEIIDAMDKFLPF